jgi:hypothetical protein
MHVNISNNIFFQRGNFMKTTNLSILSSYLTNFFGLFLFSLYLVGCKGKPQENSQDDSAIASSVNSNCRLADDGVTVCDQGRTLGGKPPPATISISDKPCYVNPYSESYILICTYNFHQELYLPNGDYVSGSMSANCGYDANGKLKSSYFHEGTEGIQWQCPPNPL